MFDTASMTEFWLRVFGLYFLAAGIGINFRLGELDGMAQQMRDNMLMRFMSGLLAFAFGVVILATHDQWTPWQAGLVTFFGWAATIKGLVMLALPGITLGMMDGIVKARAFMRIWAIAIVVIGAVLLWQGFG